MSTFGSFHRQICGRYAPELKQVCTKTELFLKKLHFFWKKGWKTPILSVFGQFYREYVADMWPIWSCTKIALFFNFRPLFNTICTEKPSKCGRYTDLPAELKFARQTAHTYVHVGAAAHNARAQPHAARRAPAQGRIRVLICACFARTWLRAHFKGGLRSKPPGVYVHDIHIRIHMSKDMTWASD